MEALLCMPNIFDVRSDITTQALLASQHPQLLEPGVMIGRHERHECPLRLCVKGRLLVVRQPQKGTERCEIFSLSSRQVLFHIRLVQDREGGELMLGMQHAVFGEPGAAGGGFCDVGGRIRDLFDRGLECAA